MHRNRLYAVQSWHWCCSKNNRRLMPLNSSWQAGHTNGLHCRNDFPSWVRPIPLRCRDWKYSRRFRPTNTCRQSIHLIVFIYNRQYNNTRILTTKPQISRSWQSFIYLNIGFRLQFEIRQKRNRLDRSTYGMPFKLWEKREGRWGKDNLDREMEKASQTTNADKTQIKNW